MADGSQTSIPIRQSFLPMTPGALAHLFYFGSSDGALKLFMQRSDTVTKEQYVLQYVQQTNYIGYEDIEVEDKVEDIIFVASEHSLSRLRIHGVDRLQSTCSGTPT
jgi:hypothetical protein